MKANQKGDTSPYDFARRSGRFGIKILWENFGTRDPGVTFVLRSDPRFSLGDWQLKVHSLFFHSPYRAMVSQASSTAMAMTVRKITRRQGGVHGEGVSYTTDQPQATTVRESGLRPGSLPLRHFCFTAIDRTPLPSNFSSPRPSEPTMKTWIPSDR